MMMEINPAHRWKGRLAAMYYLARLYPHRMRVRSGWGVYSLEELQEVTMGPCGETSDRWVEIERVNLRRRP